jgi:D-3-phosphoglycerate dehydrogenase
MALVAVTDHVFPDLDQERTLLAGAGHELRFGVNATSVEEVREAVAGADAVLNCYAPMPADVIRGLDRCVVIARYGIGLDTVDLEQATAQGILVTNVPDYCIDEVSDHALALILSLARGVTLLDRKVRAGSWTPTDARPLHRLRGQTLGLVGFGRIARALASKMAPLGFRVVTTDPFVPDDAVRDAGAEPMTLEELLVAADVVSVHAPLTADSRHLIGAAELGLMKTGAILVNTSRGPLVDLDALRASLAEGRLGGVGLDVLEVEPPASS